MPQAVKACRACGSLNLEPMLSLGQQALTGVFPKSASVPVTVGPLQLVRCRGECGLVQLMHSYEAAEMYGQNYGYRSSLNKSMVEHLNDITATLRKIVTLQPGDAVLDIGSNDGTLLKSYEQGTVKPFGMDPSAEKFRHYYREDAKLVVDFFSADRFLEVSGGQKAKIVTSIAMFYDLDEPLSFMKQVERVLDESGVWHFEQSHVGLMLERNAYDTICHEHVEYYALQQIEWMIQRAGLKIVDVQLNDINGGSFAVTAAKAGSPLVPNQANIDRVRKYEADLGLHTDRPYNEFAERVAKHRTELVDAIKALQKQGKRVLGYGASTKGNVILQYCGFTPELLPAIAEVNADKFGSVTPGTHIPIISEADAKAQKPDVFVVFPWHFRDNLVAREKAFLAGGGALLFPLPAIELVRS